MTCQQNLVMADFTSKSAIFCAPTPELGATVSTLPGRIAGQMAELLMNSAIARLGALCSNHDQLRRSHHLSRGQPGHDGALMTNQPIQVFLDATTLIKVGPPPGNETFSRLVDLVQYGLITVVTTDLTIAEVVRHHSDVACDTLRPLFNPRLLRSASRYLRIQIPDISDRDVRERVQSQISEGVASMFSRLNTTVLKIDEVMPSKIFDDYDQNMGFFVNRNKKNQFPTRQPATSAGQPAPDTGPGPSRPTAARCS